MGRLHTPGPACDECEGFCVHPVDRRIESGLEISLRLGQRVRHHDYNGRRVTGKVRGLSIDSDRVLQAEIVLDAPIVIPAHGPDDREINIWHQHVPAHELTAFDERDEVIAELLVVAQRCEKRLALEKWRTDGPREALAPESVLLLDVRAAIAKAAGSAP